MLAGLVGRNVRGPGPHMPGLSKRFRSIVGPEGAVCLLMLCAPAQYARAAEITWSATPRCGDVAAIRSQVGQLIRRELEAVADLDFEVRAASAEGEPWQVTIRTRTRSTRTERVRELSATSCAEVQQVVALAIAMTISAREHGEEEPSLAAAAVQEPPAGSDAPATAHARSPPSLARAGGVQFGLGAAFALDYGALPALAKGAQLELSLRFLEVLRVVALGTLFLPERAMISGTGQGGDFRLALAAILGCAELGSRRVLGLGCAGFEVGGLSVETVRLIPLDTRTRVVYGPRAELGLSWRITAEIAVFVRLAGTFPLRRPVFESEQRRLFQTSWATARGAIGAEYSF